MGVEELGRAGQLREGRGEGEVGEGRGRRSRRREECDSSNHCTLTTCTEVGLWYIDMTTNSH